MPERDNPFNPGAGTMPPHLAGREAERRQFLLLLRDLKKYRSGNMVVHGLRGMGKTVLMREFRQMCNDENVLPVTQSQYTQDHSEPSLFVDQLKRDMRNAIETFSKLEKTKSKIQSAVRYIKPASVGVPGMVYYEPSYNAGSSRLLQSYMVDYLIKNWEVVEKGGYNGAVFLFDEFHTVCDYKQKGWSVLSNFIGAVNAVQAEGCRYATVLCGLPVLQSNLKVARSYSERMFRSLWISTLDDADASMALTKPLEGVGRSFSRGVLASIIRETGGYPYFIQFYAKEILDWVDSDNIGMRDYERVRGRITAILDRDFFDQRMTQITNSQKTTLYAMSNVRGSDITFSAVKKHARISSGTFAKNLARLEEKGLVYKIKHGVYQFTLPLFREYLLRQQKSKNDQDLNE